MLQFTCDECQIVVTDDYGYTPGSADDPRPYDRVHDLTDGEFRPTSRHAVAVGCGGAQLRSCVVLAGGGASGVHEHQHSAFVHGDRCLLAVGPYLCALSLPALDLLSRAAVDAATYFGVYHAVSRQRYISHGELEVARVSYDGEVVWRVGGGDIFTGGFALYEDHVEVVDWNDHEYRIDLATGACVAGEV